MTDDDLIKENNKFLLEEYKQVYEQFRHCDNIAGGKEAIYAIAAFGVFTFVIIKDLSVCTTIGAAVVSFFLYLYHVLACEKMHCISETTIARLKDIEIIINPEINKTNEINNIEKNHMDKICFQTKIGYYENKKKKKEHKNWFKIRYMRRVLLVLLFALWIFFIIFKTNEIDHSSQKNWSYHKQTKHHRIR